MAKLVATEALIVAVDKGLEDDMYPVMAYLRDTYIPLLRPLYTQMQTLCFTGCKAAGVVKHTMDDGSVTYELIVILAHIEHRYKVHLKRAVPTKGEFTDYITQVPQ